MRGFGRHKSWHAGNHPLNDPDRQPRDDIPIWYALVAACPDCPRGTVIDRESLIRRYGKNARLHDLERQLKCTKCGGRGRCRFAARKIPR
ncbi:hypothetical protein EV131_105383 [Rhizobium laguerreae]|uniref:Uncharacterized protein n=1 Tax=Rhizobium laguerreae TaxID=1076926 RepID=A0AAX2QMM3_9HYPH|nr:hypothetical protein EV131_105383 [Rhizobium laguerreae]